MKRCLSCQRIHSEPVTCPHCGHTPAEQDELILFAPDLAIHGGNYQPCFYEKLVNLEAGSFWFQARNRLILWALNGRMPPLGSFLEVGCGTGFVLQGLARKFPQAHLSGSELSIQGLVIARQRLPQCNFFQMDARDIPFGGEFDAIGNFDVLEHIENDIKVIAQMACALKPGGYLVITVPQHPWLWSHLDVSAGHLRRYTASDLHSKIKSAGLSLEWSGSFVSLLLPVLWLSRWSQRFHTNRERSALPELELSPMLNTIFSFFTRIEFFIIGLGLRFPWGGSRMIVAKKPLDCTDV